MLGGRGAGGRRRPERLPWRPWTRSARRSGSGRGRASGPPTTRYDPELLAHGDRRNVVDRYRYWTLEAIVADLDTRRHPFHVAIENWAHDLNIGSVVRTANAFLAAEVHIVGNRRWNRRGAMVTDRYQHVRHHPTVDDLLALGADAGRSRCSASTTCPAPSRSRATRCRGRACCCSARSPSGLSDAARAAAVDVLHIAQFGSTRSINAGAAAAIAMHAWIAQHAVQG